MPLAGNTGAHPPTTTGGQSVLDQQYPWLLDLLQIAQELDEHFIFAAARTQLEDEVSITDIRFVYQRAGQ